MKKILPDPKHKSAPSNRCFVVLPDEGSRANFLNVALTKKKRGGRDNGKKNAYTSHARY
jgi:hypothetical protein